MYVGQLPPDWLSFLAPNLNKYWQTLIKFGTGSYINFLLDNLQNEQNQCFVSRSAGTWLVELINEHSGRAQ